ncbi:MAG: nicotinate dehydrogenase subunit, partial [Acidobacteriaceae bacterium]|nr:nicotinate dehydrogenase subunit [Acidobacteriaceae bacterium]
EMGATVAHVDEQSVRDLPGLMKVVVRKDFVGVVAQTQYQAVVAARKLVVRWNPGPFDHARRTQVLPHHLVPAYRSPADYPAKLPTLLDPRQRCGRQAQSRLDVRHILRGQSLQVFKGGVPFEASTRLANHRRSEGCWGGFEVEGAGFADRSCGQSRGGKRTRHCLRGL